MIPRAQLPGECQGLTYLRPDPYPHGIAAPKHPLDSDMVIFQCTFPSSAMPSQPTDDTR